MFVEASLIAFLNACFEFAERRLRRSSARQPCEPSEDVFQPSSRPYEGCCCAILRVGTSLLPLYVVMLRHLSLDTRTRTPLLERKRVPKRALIWDTKHKTGFPETRSLRNGPKSPIRLNLMANGGGGGSRWCSPTCVELTTAIIVG